MPEFVRLQDRSRIWTRDHPNGAWYDPVVDLDGDDGSWESRQDAEATAEQLQIRATAMTVQEMAEPLGVRDQVAPDDLQVIVLHAGERPDDAVQVLISPSGEQVPSGPL